MIFYFSGIPIGWRDISGFIQNPITPTYYMALSKKTGSDPKLMPKDQLHKVQI